MAKAAAIRGNSEFRVRTCRKKDTRKIQWNRVLSAETDAGRSGALLRFQRAGMRNHAQNSRGFLRKYRLGVQAWLDPGWVCQPS
jgi:hypothetical protein